MDRQSDNGETDPTTSRDRSTSKRKPYRTPRLVTYGELKDLALAKGGNKGDGIGKPATKA